MKNTSLGFHTFSFFQRAKENDFFPLTSDFIICANNNSDMKRFPIKNKKGHQIGWEYAYKSNKGIRWLLLSFEVNNGITIQGVMVIINPKALIEGNYIVASQADDLKKVEELYNNEAARISPLLLKFGLCSLNRADPCLNVDLEELGLPCTPEQMMVLIKQGNIPKPYKEREKYNEKHHRKIADENSFYLENKSCVINYYWKYPKQQDENHPNFLFREDSRNVIRLEVQCKYLKLYPLSKKIRHKSKLHVSETDLSADQLYEMIVNDERNLSIPIDVVLSDEISDDIIRKHFNRIIRKGDYFTLDGARSIVESYDLRRDREDRIVYALELINECRGIAKAKSKLHGPDLVDFNRSLKDLDTMLVNPVTIPRRWNIRHIPNLLQSYTDAIYEEQIISKEEHIAIEYINDFLSE